MINAQQANLTRIKFFNHDRDRDQLENEANAWLRKQDDKVLVTDTQFAEDPESITLMITTFTKKI